MVKRTITSVESSGAPSFDGEDYAPDNSQNARRFFKSFAGAPEMGNAVTVEVSEMSAPSDTAKGPGKIVCRVRYSLPQLKLITPVGVAAQLSMTGLNEYVQSTFTVTVPAFWAKVILGQVPASAALQRYVATMIRASAIDAITGVFGDTNPDGIFPTAVFTAALQTTSPLFRGLQGATPEDVFNGMYGVQP